MHYRLDASVIKNITDANDIVDIIEEFLPLKKAGANFNTNCPFHKEKTPSFVVSQEKQIYHCFGCGESGDSIKFLMKYKNYTFVEAAEYLAKRAGIILETIKNNNFEDNNKILMEKSYKINREAASLFYRNLRMNPQIQKYLYSRKIDQNVIKMFGIGYANIGWDNLLTYLLEKGYSKEDILKTGLIIKNETKHNYYDRFRNRVIFPIFDVKKRIIGFGGRVIDDSLPKYLNSPESIVFSKGNNVYGINFAKESVRDKSFFLVEGYMDVIKMHIYGYNTSVAALGTSLTENQIKLLKRYSKNYYVCFDSDDAGKKAALRSMNMLKKNNLNGKAIIVLGAKDPDEYLNKYGKINFDNLIENSLDYYHFLEFYYKDIYENSNKIEYINKFFENVINVNSEIEKELIFEKLSAKLGVSKESIVNEYNKKYKNKKTYVKNVPKPVTKLQIKKITTCHEENIVKMIFHNNDFALYLKDIVKEETFKDLEYYNVFKTMYEYISNNQSINNNNITEILENKINVSDIVLNDNDNVDCNNLEALFKDCIKRLKIKYYEEKRILLSNNIKQTEDMAESNIIMQEIFSLAKKIKSTKEEVC